MAQRALRPCGWPGCIELIRSGRFCPGHAASSNRAYDSQRGSGAARGYGARWRRLRLLVLRAHPLCADPYGDHDGRAVAATDVDHILARRSGGDDSLGNLQALCHSCHSKKTAMEDGRWGMG